MKQTSELDWLFGWMVADRAACLGNARVFVKKILKYVPVVGWAWNFRYLYIFIFQLDSNTNLKTNKELFKEFTFFKSTHVYNP